MIQAIAVEDLPAGVESGIASMIGAVDSFGVIDNETYVIANDRRKIIKGIKKEITTFFAPMKSKAHELHKAITTAERQKLESLEPAMTFYGKLIVDYDRKQEQIRQDEENRLRIKAEKEAEERQLAEAVELEKAGHKEEAVAVLEEETFTPVPVVQKATPKLDGTTFVTTYGWETIDESLIPKKYWILDTVIIGKEVRAFKEKTDIPGIRITKNKRVQ
ncbi:MAG: hypothetical protein ACUZ8H_16275 [Candidatus Anammoxibacter sp.]